MVSFHQKNPERCRKICWGWIMEKKNCHSAVSEGVLLLYERIAATGSEHWECGRTLNSGVQAKYFSDPQFAPASSQKHTNHKTERLRHQTTSCDIPTYTYILTSKQRNTYLHLISFTIYHLLPCPLLLIFYLTSKKTVTAKFWNYNYIVIKRCKNCNLDFRF